jgi:hypothetical protein
MVVEVFFDALFAEGLVAGHLAAVVEADGTTVVKAGDLDGLGQGGMLMGTG